VNVFASDNKSMTFSILQTVGRTPLAEIDGVRAKIEFFNPSGSIKDRMVKFMIEEAEKRGELESGKIMEATSGNTGIALAMISAAKGYKASVFMPKDKSIERRKLMKAYSAELVLTGSMEEAVEKAREKAGKENAFYLNQFENPDNVKAHYMETGKELLEQVSNVDVLVAGVGTGGTLVGVGKRIREKFPEAKIVGVLPSDESNKIEGIGCYYNETLFKEDFADEIIEVSNAEAMNSARYLIGKGLFVGISSGANFSVAKKFSGQDVVTFFPDSADRYLSTELFRLKGLK